MMLVNLSSIFSQTYDYRWWDINWHYRIGLEINSTGYNRTNWTIEYPVNFTQLLQNMSVTGAFDENSTRVIEYNSSGSILHQIPSQFDRGDNYNSISNAAGVIAFTMNDTTVANHKRYFYIYFDITQNGNKIKPSYPTDLSYNYTGNVAEFYVNNSLFRWEIDTERGENTSGIYHVQDVAYENDLLRVDDATNMTVEYSEFSNASSRFGFDFRNNATLKYSGPVRIVVEQIGQEIFWNQPDNKTNEGYMIKRYIFYRYTDWMKIEQIFVNNASHNITRNSTTAGALGINVSYSFSLPGGNEFYPNMTNPLDPGSYGWAAQETGNWWLGITNIYENGTTSFFALEDSQTGRIGIQLNQTTIPAGSTISHIAAIQFNGSGEAGQEEYFLNFVNQSNTPLNITTHASEAWTVVATGKFYMNYTSEAAIFNRNETVIITANVTDLYNLSGKVNASLNLGGTGEFNITLYDDGTHGDGQANDNLYANSYNVLDSDTIGTWNTTFKVYNESGTLLNSSWFTFNVTNIYNVSVNISNPTGFTGRVINATVYVKNYRRDSPIIGAYMNCSYESTVIPQQNISDNGDGSYRVWFAAPAYSALFTLTCNATRNNNTGTGSGEFTCETYVTNMSISTTPTNFTVENMTSYANSTFNITVFTQNIANGTAYDMNITLNFSTSNITANITSEACGNVLISKSCTKYFQIIVLNGTPQGNYSVNVSTVWRNSNENVSGYNSTLINVTVLPNPQLNVSDTFVLGIIAAGNPLRNVKNFTLYSIGNEPLYTLNMTIQGFSGNFIFSLVPPSIPALWWGNSQIVQVWVNATLDTPPGEYNGTINVTTANDGFKTINLTLSVSGTNISIESDVHNFTAGNVTWYQNQSFPVFVSTVNTGNSTAYNVTINLNFSSAGITSNVSSFYCGNVPKWETCNTSFLITILAQTHSGNYTANLSVQWEDPEKGTNFNSTLINITVLSQVNLTILQNAISNNVTHGTEKEIGTLSLNSTGNDPIENIIFTVYNFSSSFYFEIMPPNVPSLGGEYPQGVKINVSVAYGQAPGIYSGILNVTTSNDGYKEINLTIEIPTNRTWTTNTTYCEKVESPEEGTACDVFINNTGNAQINFTITPATNVTSQFNRTWNSANGFLLNKGQSLVLSVYYNVTNQTIKFYYANYTINAVESGSNPDYVILQVILNPYIKPGLSVQISPNMTEQTEYVWVYANVTDQGGAGINDGNVTVTVRRPGGSNDTMVMFFYGGSQTGGTSRWRARYYVYSDEPYQGVTWGNTTNKGYYNITVFALDNQGKNNTVNNTYFYVYSKLLVELNTSRYAYWGDSREIRIKTHDAQGDILGGTTVNLNLTDPNGGNKDYYMWLGKTFVTDSNGDAGGLYIIPMNAITGNYTFASNSSYYVSGVARTINNTNSTIVDVREKSEVTAMVDVPDPSARETMMPVSVLLFDHGACIPDEPDAIDLTIYYTQGYSMQPWRQLTKANMTKNTNCSIYTYTELLGSGVLTGTYLAVLKVSYHGIDTWGLKAFRITTGGPYDVSVNMLETDVPKADYADFELLLTNMGYTTPDVLVEYWVSGANQTWSYRSESVMVNANANRTLLRNLYILSDQPVGQYYVNAKITYDQANNLYATANASFNVIEGGVIPQPPGPTAPGAAEGAKGAISAQPPKIEIVKYSPEIGMELEVVKYPTVEVKNTGGSKLYNVTLRVTGIPSPWIEDISPKVVPELATGNSSIFTITLKIPSTAETKEYTGQIIADANVTRDEKTFTLTLFSSRAQLIRWEIDRLKKAFQEFQVDVENAQKAGKDTKDVLPYIDEIKEHISVAEDYLEKKMYDDSLSEVHSGWSALEKAIYLLSQAPFVQILIETIFPPWLIAILVVLVVAIVILLFFVRKMRGVFDRIFRLQAPGGAQGAMKTTLVVEKMKEREALEKEEMNTRRVLNLLERQFKEGLITENAYMSLKARNEEKLAKIGQMKSAVK